METELLEYKYISLEKELDEIKRNTENSQAQYVIDEIKSCARRIMTDVISINLVDILKETKFLGMEIHSYINKEGNRAYANVPKINEIINDFLEAVAAKYNYFYKKNFR
jgi:hypothetical protein